MKKVVALGLISIMFLGAGAVHAEEVTVEDEPVIEVVEEKKTCKIIESVSDGGDILFDKTEGEVGDTVTFTVKPDLLFAVESIEVNGTIITLNDNGVYKFQLIEGDNIVNVKFFIDNDKLEKLVEMVDSVKENGFSSVFNVDNLIKLISLVVTTFFTSGFFLTLIKNKKLKTKTVNEVQGAVLDVLNSESAKAVGMFLDKLMPEVMDKINLKIDNVDKCIKTLCKCLTLAQSNDPADRLAIVQALSDLNVNDDELSDQIVKLIHEEQAKQAQIAADKEKAIQELKDVNESLTIEDEIIKENGDEYGEL